MLDGSVFIFLNRSRTHVKLHWDGDGFELYYKRLERSTYEMPAHGDNGSSLSVSYQQLLFMLQGVALKKIEYRKRYRKTG
ncbi:MAG: IS66 family insertion sequence element accessory protein TnpB [Chitinophagaceae bacterium]